MYRSEKFNEFPGSFGYGPLFEPLPDAMGPPVSERWAYAVGEALGDLDPGLGMLVRKGGTALARLTGQEEERRVRTLAGLLALWVGELPASERHHHSHAFGLLLHSVEVAALVVSRLEERWLRNDGGPALSTEERSLWVRVAYTTALLHDVGKVQEMVVGEDAGGGPWDPLREPLASWKRKRHLEFDAPSSVRHLKYRGLRGHAGKGIRVAQAMLRSCLGRDLAFYTLWALTAYSNRHELARTECPAPLAYIAHWVHRADLESSWSYPPGAGHSRSEAEESLSQGGMR